MCNKVKFDKKTALTILNRNKKENKKYRAECRIYQCPDEECENMWHLTSEIQYSKREHVSLIFTEEWEKLKSLD